MSVKTTGAEWKKFYNDPGFWPPGAWHDDEVITVGGVACEEVLFDDVADNQQFTVHGGVVYLKENDRDGPSLESHFRRWRKRQSNLYLCVVVPRDKETELREFLKQIGGAVAK